MPKPATAIKTGNNSAVMMATLPEVSRQRVATHLTRRSLLAGFVWLAGIMTDGSVAELYGQRLRRGSRNSRGIRGHPIPGKPDIG